MGYFKFLNKIFPASPDAILKKAPESEAALARMAHVNCIVNDLSDIAFYTLELDQTNTLPINTNKGIIEIQNINSIVPDPAFDTNIIFVLTNNPVLNLANRDNIYLQLTAYYNPAANDEFVPYVISSGMVDGLNVKIYNASPIPAGAGQGLGAFYLYYEIKSIA